MEKKRLEDLKILNNFQIISRQLDDEKNELILQAIQDFDVYEFKGKVTDFSPKADPLINLLRTSQPTTKMIKNDIKLIYPQGFFGQTVTKEIVFKKLSSEDGQRILIDYLRVSQLIPCPCIPCV